MIGETLSHFKIVGKLGEGGMGVVYRADDMNLDRPVAIKVLPPEAQRDEESLGRFLREAKTASKLQHANITTIYEFGVKADLRYLVMEFVDGKTLKEMLKQGPLPARQLLEIAIQIVDALSLADEKAIIHRDIKSENLMLTNRGQVKILDFGLAKMVEKAGAQAQDAFHTSAGMVMGTISHMSPEQALGAELDARTDIYSTGVVLFEMATGKLPFTGNSPNVMLAKILNQPAPSASDINSEVSPALEQVIAKCLEKNREQRYQNALRLLVDLRGMKQQIDSGRDWSGTVVMQPGRDLQVTAPPAEKLSELVPPTPQAARPAVTPPGGVATVAVPARGVAPPPSAPARDSGALTPSVPRTAAISPSARAWRLGACTGLSVLRKGLGLVAIVYAMGCVALFALPVFRPERVRGLTAVRWLHEIIDPLVAFAYSVINVDLTYQNFNFLLVGLALLTYIVAQVVIGRLEGLESWLRKPLLTRPAVAGGGVHIGGGRPGHAGVGVGGRDASRMSLLRDYAATKRVLGEVKKDLAFLSIDVVGSTKMKVGEDKIVVEHAFTEYKKFLEHLFHEYRAYKVAWTPDGVMSCFPSVEDASTMGRKLLVELDWFNRDVHQLRIKFHVRCGLNAGEVMVPDEKPLEDISDETIDVAGHLQKYAAADSLWVSGDVYRSLASREDFVQVPRQVDNRDVYAWQKPS